MFFKTLFGKKKCEFKFSNVALQSLDIKLILYCCSDKVREMHDPKWHDLWFFPKFFLSSKRKVFNVSLELCWLEW